MLITCVKEKVEDSYPIMSTLDSGSSGLGWTLKFREATVSSQKSPFPVRFKKTLKTCGGVDNCKLCVYLKE